MENKMQDSKMWEDLKQAINNLTKEDLYNYISDTMVFPEEWDANLASEISKAKEEMFTEDEVWTLSALVESKIDEIWDTMTLGTEKIVQEQSDDLHRLLSKLNK